jgi:hypothetical protein
MVLRCQEDLAAQEDIMGNSAMNAKPRSFAKYIWGLALLAGLAASSLAVASGHSCASACLNAYRQEYKACGGCSQALTDYYACLAACPAK